MPTRELDDDEVSSFDHISDGLCRRVKLIRTNLLPPAADGMTIGRFVFLRSDVNRDGTRELLAHELVHVRQYAEYGLVGFLMRYLRDYVRGLWTHKRHRAAYLAIPAEVEAREEAHRWKLARP